MKKEIPTIKELQTIATSILERYEKAGDLKFNMPLRSTSNAVYDKKLRQYVVGGKKKEIDVKNISQSKAFTQRAWLMWFIKNELLAKDKTTTLRDVFYSSQAVHLDFDAQSLSDDAVEDIEAIASLPREKFNIVPDNRGNAFGDLTIEYIKKGYQGKRVSLLTSPDGMEIGQNLAEAKFVSHKLKMVLVVEKEALFNRFVEDGVDKTYKALVIGLKGMSTRNGRLLIRRLSNELKLPVFVFADSDPWGMRIVNTLIHGSADLSHLKGLNVPDAVWAGIYPSDFKKYSLPTVPFTEADVKGLEDMKRSTRYESGIWKREIGIFAKERKKAELEAFSAKGLSFIVNKYLPERLKELGVKGER